MGEPILRIVLVMLSAASLAACAAPPLGPMVPVTPGAGKPFAQFQDDDFSCRRFADGRVAGAAEMVNQQAAGGVVLGTVVGAGLGAIVGGGRGAAVGAVTGAGLGTGITAGQAANAQGSIQYQYDGAYAQCMVSRGNQVPGFQPAYGYQPAYPAPVYAPAPGRSDLVRAVQYELNRLGYLSSPPDGVPGRQTVSAIESFEAGRGLPVDGAATQFLLDRLREVRTSY